LRRRATALLAALALGFVLAACGSSDNGGVIQGPTGTTVAPGTSTTAGGSGTPGY
jgi:hypothetical protein